MGKVNSVCFYFPPLFSPPSSSSLPLSTTPHFSSFDFFSIMMMMMMNFIVCRRCSLSSSLAFFLRKLLHSPSSSFLSRFFLLISYPRFIVSLAFFIISFPHCCLLSPSSLFRCLSAYLFLPPSSHHQHTRSRTRRSKK